MATMNFYAARNMAAAQTWYGSVTGNTSSQITITNGYSTGIYYGSFSYSGYSVYGTLTGYAEYAGSSMIAYASGLSISASLATQYIDANQLQNVFAIALVGNDNVNGSSQNDVLLGYGGNDIFQGGGGIDTIDGGDGSDTVIFSGVRSQYTVSGSGVRVVVSDNVIGRNGVATILNTEFLRFSDQTISTNLSPTYFLSASSAFVNEGSVANFILTTSNVAIGAQVAYALSGVSAADIQGGGLAGTTTVGTNGQAIISVSVLADGLTEGPETLRVTAAGATSATIINDTSKGSATGINGTVANDKFVITSGSNSVDGGAGSDNVQYQTTRSAASVIFADGVITVGKANGTDTLISVERIDFTDGDLVFDISSANAPAAYRLYGGAFDRTPDESGFRYWTQTFDNGASLHDVAASFIASPEFISRYGNNLSNAAFVDALYLNVLGRSGEAGGVAHWNRMLDNKYQDRADVLVEFTQLPEYVGISQADIKDGYWVL